MVETIKARSLAFWVAWSVVGAVFLLFAGQVALETAGCNYLYDPLPVRPADSLGALTFIIMNIAFAVLGALIISYHPENRIGWLSILAGFLGSSGNLMNSYGLCAYQGIIEATGDFRFYLWLDDRIISSLFILALAVFMLLFPNGQFLSKGWRRLTAIWVVLAIITVVLNAFLPGRLLDIVPNPAPELQNPYYLTIPTTNLLYSVLKSATGLGIFLLLVGIVSLYLRWRQASGEVRQQIKWVALFLLTSGLLFICVEIIGISTYPAIFDGWFYLFDIALFFLGLPVVFGLAIFKYRLYDIDLIIRRTIQYSLVTLILALVYFAAVALLQRSVATFAGNQSPLAIVISTLLIAALFAPLRQRVQHFIDRRFFRQKYDAQQVLAQFAHTAQNEVSLEVLRAELTQVVQETIEPTTVAIWVKE